MATRLKALTKSAEQEKSSKSPSTKALMLKVCATQQMKHLSRELLDRSRIEPKLVSFAEASPTMTQLEHAAEERRILR